jgi:hypothetical protein
MDLQEEAEIFYWPAGRHELNLSGKPGKLHAKAAVVDKRSLLASANLTDDVFIRNLELGVLFMGGEKPAKLRQHLGTSSQGVRLYVGVLEVSTCGCLRHGQKHRFVGNNSPDVSSQRIQCFAEPELQGISRVLLTPCPSSQAGTPRPPRSRVHYRSIVYMVHLPKTMTMNFAVLWLRPFSTALRLAFDGGGGVSTNAWRLNVSD